MNYFGLSITSTPLCYVAVLVALSALLLGFTCGVICYPPDGKAGNRSGKAGNRSGKHFVT
jgi:hypothetical protein